MELAFPEKPPQWPDGGRQEVNASGKDVGVDASPLGQGPGRGGRSQSVYGQSSQAIYDWDDGWKSSDFPQPQPVYTGLSFIYDDRLDIFHGPMTIEPPFPKSFFEGTTDMPRRKLILTAAQTGNDQLIDFLISCSLADADQPPLPSENVSFSTPMLAAIGLKNARVIEALLKQKDFNPTRRFCGLTYYEIAEKRRGLAWEDEVRLLKEAFDNASRHQSINSQTKEPITLRLITDRSYSNPPSVSGEDIIEGTDFYNCGWCRYSFSSTEQLHFHRERCFARPFSTIVKLDLTREKIAMHLKLQYVTPYYSILPFSDIKRTRSSSLIKPMQTPLQPTPLVQVRTIRRTLSDPGLSISTNKLRRHFAKLLDRGEIADMNIPCLGLAGNGSDAMDSTSSSTLSTDNNLYRDDGLSRQSVEGQATEILNPPRLFETNSMTDLSSPQTTESSARHASETTTPLTAPSQGDSEISDFSMNDGSEDSHCEEESPFVRRAERRRTSLRDLMDAVYSTYTRVVTPGAMDGGESGPSNASGGESDSTGPSNNYDNYLNTSSVESSPELKPTAKSYDEFLQRELFRRIYRVLENKVDDALDSAEKNVVDGLKSQLEEIIRDVQTQLYEEFQTTFRPGEGQASNENDENASYMPISGMDPTLLLQDMFPLSSSSPPWSALGLEHQQAGPSASIPQLPYELMDISNISFEPLSSPVDANNNHDSSMTSSALFTVKAAHDYTSDYAEDLSFRVGQIITVTNDNEVDWYTGEYLDEFGMKKWGIFPRNLVERYPPPVPPRPTRGYDGNAGPASATFTSTFLPSYTA
ncbi:hypothetical protein Daesc_006648 [Daldinia eschscholtzii]|uniref:SH3 domain-containing protein n=1 Tax=Daldinia eschscholtzii TaxID=292717 RepID=A0AAX6MI40_9PEZI